MSDENYIRQTFELARLGLGKTFPNPLVGAVIVKDGRILSSGFHHQHGQDHAELDAIKNCPESMVGATLYVNLEPCCHTNKQTPPCAQRLIQEKFKKIVICNLDPNPLVNGKGVELLRQNGIEVEHGILSSEGEKLNEAFFFAQRNQLPFVHLKLATTLDGMISMPNGESQWITGEASRREVHQMRALHQAIMVGAETLRVDNPKLNVRLPNYSDRQPYRIVFTKSGKLPTDSTIFTDELKEKTLLFTMTDGKFALPPENIFKFSSLKEAMKILFEKKLINLFLEGGPSLASSFMQAGLINRVSLFMNPSFLGTGKSALTDFGVSELNKRPHLKDIESRWLEGDLLLTGKLK